MFRPGPMSKQSWLEGKRPSTKAIRARGRRGWDALSRLRSTRGNARWRFPAAGLVTILTSYEAPEISVYAIYPAKVRVFIDFLASTCAWIIRTETAQKP